MGVVHMEVDKWQNEVTDMVADMVSDKMADMDVINVPFGHSKSFIEHPKAFTVSGQNLKYVRK